MNATGNAISAPSSGTNASADRSTQGEHGDRQRDCYQQLDRHVEPARVGAGANGSRPVTCSVAPSASNGRTGRV